MARGGSGVGLLLLSLGILGCASATPSDKVRGKPGDASSGLSLAQLAKSNALEHAGMIKRLAILEKKLGVTPQGEPPKGPDASDISGSTAGHGDIEKYASPFQKGFLASFAMIILSELGDKTFFIAAILAMRHPRGVVFLGAIAALALMTVLSAAMGYAAPLLLPHHLTHYLGAILFLYFGVQLIREAREAEAGVSDELAETEEELYQKDNDEESGSMEEDPSKKDRRNPLGAVFSPIMIKTFTLTFVAEWGDRSQIATIALAAAKNVYGVTAGGVLGHALCTGIAVVGGKMLAERISEKTMLYLGGAVFLVFGVVDLLIFT